MRGPLYGVKLIETLRLNPLSPNPHGLRQQMPTEADLRAILQDHCRVVAGYEILTDYFQRLRKLFARFEAMESTVETHVGTNEPHYMFTARCDTFVEIGEILKGVNT